MRRLLVLLAACGGAQPAGPPRPPTLTVADAGAEPRRIVRYDVPPHTSARVELHEDLTLAQSVTNTVLEQAASHVAFPTVTILQRAEVTEALPDGSVLVRTDTERATYEGTIPDTAIGAQFDRTMRYLRRRHTTYRLAPDGTVADVHIDDGGKRPHDTSGLGEPDVPIVFPPTPIGVGATWTLTQTQLGGGIQWHRTLTCHLRALDDTSASVEYETTSSAPSQPLWVEPSRSTKLTTAHASGGGHLLIPLHSLAPTGGSHATSEATLSIIDKDLRIETTIQTQLETQVRPAD